MSLKRQRSPSPTDTKPSQQNHDVWKSTKIEDRTSIFIAYFSPTMPPRDLQSQADLKSATHRMLAWRTPGSQRTLIAKTRTIESGCDDDGESYGGKRALKVLNEMRVEGAVVVARWYGGVMLGPVRFTHIEDVVRDAVRAWQQNEESESQKRRKIEDEANEKANLVSDLQERDQSIKVLRGLLEEKMAVLNPPEQAVKRPSAAPSREIDYSSMTLERLKQMDKARDSTVAFLLKRIDEVEKQQEALAVPPAPVSAPAPAPAPVGTAEGQSQSEAQGGGSEPAQDANITDSGEGHKATKEESAATPVPTNGPD